MDNELEYIFYCKECRPNDGKVYSDQHLKSDSLCSLCANPAIQVRRNPNYVWTWWAEFMRTDVARHALVEEQRKERFGEFYPLYKECRDFGEFVRRRALVRADRI